MIDAAPSGMRRTVLSSRDGKRLRRAALCGKAGGGDGHLRCIPAIRLELVAEFAELQLGAADLGGGTVAGLADDTLRLGAVFHPDEVQAEVLLLPPLQKEGERQLPGPGRPLVTSVSMEMV